MKTEQKHLLVEAAIFMLCIIMAVAIVYGVAAFVTWAADPAEWSEGLRFLVACLAIISGVGAGGIIITLMDAK